MRLLLFSATISALLGVGLAVTCLDCVGKDCMGEFCEGDYCMISKFAPRWGTVSWGEPRVVKGCMSGSMLRKGIKDHCETDDEDASEVFTCFCNAKNNCNSGSLKKMEVAALIRKSFALQIQPVELLTCRCEGSHCRGDTCVGELCSYVVNHKTKEVEKGCVNASVPLVERRSAGACMMPPITGAMHHSVAKDAEALLVTESCVCGSDYCNAKKPKVTVKENQKCHAFVRAKMMGNTMASKNVTCSGEFCFKAHIKSDLGHMQEYNTLGCASFVDGATLAEELNPTGCAKFESEKLEVEACFTTTDKAAVRRAKENQEEPEPPRRKPSGKGGKKPKMEIEYEDDDEEEEEEVKKKPKGKEEKAPSKEKTKEEESEEEEEEEEEEKKEEKEKEERTTAKYIFEAPTEVPTPEDSNFALFAVFGLIIICILMAGVVWKFELHKKLFRANYDTVAGG